MSGKTPKTKRIKHGRKSTGHMVALMLILLILLLLTFSLNWAVASFGNIGFDGIVFTLNMPLQGTDQSFIDSYLQKALLPAVGVYAEIVIGLWIAHALLRMFTKPYESLKGLKRYAGLACALFFIGWIGMEFACCFH